MKISVAICTYNGGRFITEQLQSIIDQELPPDDIVVCDDGSTDDTISIIDSFAARYPGLIKLHRNEKNLRTNKNFEKAISLCTGDLIFLSDQDDVWKPNKTQRIVAEFHSKPEMMGIFSNADLISESGERNERGSLWENVQFIDQYIGEQTDLFRYIGLLKNMVTGAALCIRKESIPLIFPFPDQSAMFHDEWIGLNLGYLKKLGFVPEHLFSYRVHSSQQIGVIKPSSLEKHIRVIKIVLGIEESISFGDLLQVRKSFYRNYRKFSKLRDNYQDAIRFPLDAIIEENETNILLTESQMKKANILLYSLHKTADKIAGKRQLKK